MLNFRNFIEEEAAPAMGGAQAPPVPGSEETHDDPRVLDKEFDIPPEARKEADESTTFTCHAVVDFPEHGLKAMPPTEITAKNLDNGNYEITVLYDGGTNSQKLQDMNGNDYRGEIKDLKRIVTENFLNFLKTAGWKAAGSGGGMGGPPPMGMGGGMGMGGPPPMGMDGGMGGGMGGPAAPPIGLAAHTEYPTLSHWLQLRETGTSTGDVAGFSRMSIPLVRRISPQMIAIDEKKKKKKPYQQPQVEC